MNVARLSTAFSVTGHKRVEYSDLISFVKHVFRTCASDVACASGDENVLHVCPPCFYVTITLMASRCNPDHIRKYRKTGTVTIHAIVEKKTDCPAKSGHPPYLRTISTEVQDAGIRETISAT